MKTTKFVLVLAFLVVMAAGAVVGIAVDRHFRDHTPSVGVEQRPHLTGPRFPEVSKEQDAQIKAIWNKVNTTRQERFDTRRAIETKRQQDTQALLSSAPELKQKFDEIQTSSRAEAQKVEDDFQRAVHKAEEDTLAVLNPDQQKQYKQFIEQRGPRRGGGPGGGGRGRGTRSRPSTNPTTLPSTSAAGAQ